MTNAAYVNCFMSAIRMEIKRRETAYFLNPAENEPEFIVEISPADEGRMLREINQVLISEEQRTHIWGRPLEVNVNVPQGEFRIAERIKTYLHTEGGE